MRALRDLQSDFADAILSGMIVGRLTDSVRPSPIAAERRVGIYRNHFDITLTESLGITFPVLKALVGERFFAQCARRYAHAHPPGSPVLFEYGRELPLSLAEAAGSEFAYLLDVGAFEWAINHAYHADDARPLGVEALAHVPAERSGDVVLALHPSAQLVRSSYPVLDIWRANQLDAGDVRADLGAGGICLLVWRHGVDVVWRTLGAGDCAFLAALLDRATLTDACAVALTADPMFDAGITLRDLFAGGAVAGLLLQPTS